MYNYKPLNYHEMSPYVDIVSWDSYPFWGKGDNLKIARNTSFQHDLMRSLKKRPFLMMESSPGPTNWQPVSKLKRPGILHAQSFQALAHGSDSVLYFQIRKGRGGFEKFHGAMIDHYGKEDDRTYQECRNLGIELSNLTDIIGTSTISEVAILFDWENWWALENSMGPRNQNMYYYETAMKSYNAFRRLGLNVDILDMTQEYDEYKILVAPMLYMYRSDIQNKIRTFVEKGGVFIATYWSGIVDEHDLCFLGETPFGLTDVLGLRNTEIDGLYDNEKNIVAVNDSNADLQEWKILSNKKYECHHLCQLIKKSSAKEIMAYEQDFYAGDSAFTVNKYGKGKAYFIGADMNQDFYDDVYEIIIKQMNVSKPFKTAVPEGIEVTTRTDGTYDYLFIQNFRDYPISLSMEFKNKNQDMILPYETKLMRFKK